MLAYHLPLPLHYAHTSYIAVLNIHSVFGVTVMLSDASWLSLMFDGSLAESVVMAAMKRYCYCWLIELLLAMDVWCLVGCSNCHITAEIRNGDCDKYMAYHDFDWS